MSYWDTSTLVKLYAQEVDSAAFENYALNAPSTAVTSRIALYEARATFQRKEDGHPACPRNGCQTQLVFANGQAYFPSMNAVEDLRQVIVVDREIMSGTPVFAGTRVPVQTLFAYLEAGDDLAEFLGDFPSVSQQQALRVLELSKNSLLSQALQPCA